MYELGTPHDRNFRESFGQRELARDFLLQNLPEALLAELDLASLEIFRDTYVGEDLSGDCSDLWRFHQAAKGRPACLHKAGGI